MMRILLVLANFGSSVALAQAPSEQDSRCAARQGIALTQAMSGSILARVGRDVVAVPSSGRRLFRTSGCSGRFRAISSPVAFTAPRIATAGDALVVLSQTGSPSDRDGHLRRLALMPTAHAIRRRARRSC